MTAVWHRYFSFHGRISRKQFVYSLCELYLFTFFVGVLLILILAGLKSLTTPEVLGSGIALIVVLIAAGVWCQCALIVRRAHDRGMSGMPIVVALVFALLFFANAFFALVTGDDYTHLMFPADRDERSIFQGIFLAAGVCLNLYFWNGLRKGSAPGADEYGPPPLPDEAVSFWTVR